MYLTARKRSRFGDRRNKSSNATLPIGPDLGIAKKPKRLLVPEFKVMIARTVLSTVYVILVVQFCPVLGSFCPPFCPPALPTRSIPKPRQDDRPLRSTRWEKRFWCRQRTCSRWMRNCPLRWQTAKHFLTWSRYTGSCVPMSVIWAMCGCKRRSHCPKGLASSPTWGCGEAESRGARDWRWNSQAGGLGASPISSSFSSKSRARHTIQPSVSLTKPERCFGSRSRPLCPSPNRFLSEWVQLRRQWTNSYARSK